MDAAVSGVDWATVAAWVVVPFAVFAVALERYARLERGHLRYARTTVSFAAGAVAVIALAIALWPPSETAKVIGFLYTCVSMALGVRFSWLADKDERERNLTRDSYEARLLTENQSLHTKVDEYAERETHTHRLALRTRAYDIAAEIDQFPEKEFGIGYRRELAKAGDDVKQQNLAKGSLIIHSTFHFNRHIRPRLWSMFEEFDHMGCLFDTYVVTLVANGQYTMELLTDLAKRIRRHADKLAEMGDKQ